MSSTSHRLAVATLFVAALPVFAQYRWTDSTGQVNYGDAPPSDAKNVSRIDGRSSTQAGDPTGGLPFELRKAMAAFPITLYTAPDCGACDSARVWLRSRSAPYQEVVVETDADIEEYRRRFGTTAVPIMTLGRTPHQGFNGMTWSAALTTAGYPSQIVLPPTYRADAPKPILPREENSSAPKK